jgi:Co/Zn/Cd efflux system component
MPPEWKENSPLYSVEAGLSLSRNSAPSAARLSAEETIRTPPPITSINSPNSSGAPACAIRAGRVTDLHLWQVGPAHRAAVISVVSDHPLPPKTYKRRLGGLRGLSHVTVAVETCPHEHA